MAVSIRAIIIIVVSIELGRHVVVRVAAQIKQDGDTTRLEGVRVFGGANATDVEARSAGHSLT